MQDIAIIRTTPDHPAPFPWLSPLRARHRSP